MTSIEEKNDKLLKKTEAKREEVKVGFIISNFLDVDKECQELLIAAENKGFELLPSSQYPSEMRNNTRLRKTDENLAITLWKRLEPFLTEKEKCIIDQKTKTKWTAVALSPNFRFCRYKPGQFFARHIDGVVIEGELHSFRTVMIYLNTVPEKEGGRTRFYMHDGKRLSIDYCYSPTAGDLFCFEQDQEHDGEALNGGLKYIMRTELMYLPTNLI